MAEATKKYISAVGRRKRAVAQVRLYPAGSGKIEINGKAFEAFFPTEDHQRTLKSPLESVGSASDFDLTVLVKGGGMTGQVESIRMGISRALVEHNPEWRTSLKKLGYLTRDARKKERKKPGLKGARRAPQFSKR